MTPKIPGLSERATRKRLIDPKLKAAGWEVFPFDPDRALSTCDHIAIEEYPTDAGPADYALCVGGQILGVVEAQKLTLGPQNALTQAERYSRGANRKPARVRRVSRAVSLLYERRGHLASRPRPHPNDATSCSS